MTTFLSSLPVDWGNVDNTADLNAVLAGGGLIFADVPTIRIDGTLQNTVPVRVIGPGMDRWRMGAAACNIITQGVTNTIWNIDASGTIADGLNFNGTAARFTASGGKAIVVGSQPGTLGDGTIEGVTLTNISACSHGGAAVHFQRAAEFDMDSCDLQAFSAGCVVENLIHADKGDSTIRGATKLSANTASGKGLVHKSSGGLRVLGIKFLDCQDSVHILWTQGLSGGLSLRGCSLENMTRRGVFAQGNGSTPMNGLDISGNWINGAVDSIFIDNYLPLDRAMITVNNIVGGATSIGINLGAMMTNAFVEGNAIDGNGQSASYGIFGRSGATGRVAPNFIHGCSTQVYNASANLVVSTQY